jgi:hypothetical protein
VSRGHDRYVCGERQWAPRFHAPPLPARARGQGRDCASRRAMGGVRLPRRRGGARRVSSGDTTDSSPRHRTSRLARLSVTSADRAPGASPASSVLAGTAPVAGLRSSARPSASSARLPRTSARLPRTSAQPPTSWERRPDGLGARKRGWGDVFKDEDALSKTPARFGRSSELAPRTWDLRSRSGDACPRGRGGLSRRSERRFGSSGRHPRSSEGLPMSSALSPMLSEGRPRSSATADRAWSHVPL